MCMKLHEHLSEHQNHHGGRINCRPVELDIECKGQPFCSNHTLFLWPCYEDSGIIHPAIHLRFLWSWSQSQVTVGKGRSKEFGFSVLSAWDNSKTKRKSRQQEDWIQKKRRSCLTMVLRSLMNNTRDREILQQKMEKGFEYRQHLIRNPDELCMLLCVSKAAGH